MRVVVNGGRCHLLMRPEPGSSCQGDGRGGATSAPRGSPINPRSRRASPSSYLGLVFCHDGGLERAAFPWETQGKARCGRRGTEVGTTAGPVHLARTRLTGGAETFGLLPKHPAPWSHLPTPPPGWFGPSQVGSKSCAAGVESNRPLPARHCPPGHLTTTARAMGPWTGA